MNNIVYDVWIDCDDENYWQTEDYDIVCWKDDTGTYLMTHRECPYGWNVLCRLRAKFMTVSNPFDIDDAF